MACTSNRQGRADGGRGIRSAGRPGSAGRGCSLALLLAAGWLLRAGSVAALEPPPLTGRVVDRAGLLTAPDAARIEQAIRRLEQASGGQMAVLILPSLDGEALEPFSIRVAETWQIGRRGHDDGAVLIVVRDDRRIRLEIGYGWEGAINDARAGDIIRGLGPYFRAGRYADGILFAVGKVQEFVTGKPLGASAPEPPATEPQAKPPALAVLVFIILVIVFVVALSRRAQSGLTLGGSRAGGFRGGFSGGGFRGGGGRFGGGGASGSW